MVCLGCEAVMELVGARDSVVAEALPSGDGAVGALLWLRMI